MVSNKITSGSGHVKADVYQTYTNWKGSQVTECHDFPRKQIWMSQQKNLEDTKYKKTQAHTIQNSN